MEQIQQEPTIDDCADLSTPFSDNYNSLPNFRFSQCITRPGTLEYTWSSIPTGFSGSTANETATVTNNPTQYIVSVNETGRPAACAATGMVEVQTYVPSVTVNPNPANICPPGTSSATLVSNATTNTSFKAPRTFTNNTAVAIPESGSPNGLCITPGATVTSDIGCFQYCRWNTGSKSFSRSID